MEQDRGRGSGGVRIGASPGLKFFFAARVKLNIHKAIATTKDTPYKIWLNCTNNL